MKPKNHLPLFRTASWAAVVVFSCGAILGAAAGEPAAGSPPPDKVKAVSEIRTAVAQGQLLPLPRILELAQGHVAGDPVKIELEMKHGVLEYEVKILTKDGRVREVKLDARTGAVIKIDDD